MEEDSGATTPPDAANKDMDGPSLPSDNDGGGENAAAGDGAAEADDAAEAMPDADEPVAGTTTPEERADGEEIEDAEEDDESGDADDVLAMPIVSIVEALLFAAREPLKLAQIAKGVGKRTRQDAVRAAIDELNVHYLETGRAFEIAEISGRFQLMSRPEFVSHIMRIYPRRDIAEKDKSTRLTPTALDTLSIIAYKQPVTRAEIEHIRGVGCGPVLKALTERGTIRVVGKKTDVVGNPLVYGTTDAFLVEFGMGSLDELPLRNELLSVAAEMEQAAAAPAPEAEAESDAEATDAPVA